MIEEPDNNPQKRIGGIASKYHTDILTLMSAKLNLPVSRLVAIALDNEIHRENSFEWNLTLPNEDLEEFAYADQAGKLIRYLTDNTRGVSLDMLLLFREDIGIKCKDELRYGLKEALDSTLISAYYPKESRYVRENTLYYRIKGAEKKARVARKKATKFEYYQKLKKEFAKEGE